MLKPLSAELPSSDVILGLENPKPILEEVLFRRIQMSISQPDRLINEQTKHRNNVLKTFADFPMMGVSLDNRSQDILAVATIGCLNRAFEVEFSEQPALQNDCFDKRLSHFGTFAKQSFSALSPSVWMTYFLTF